MPGGKHLLIAAFASMVALTAPGLAHAGARPDTQESVVTVQLVKLVPKTGKTGKHLRKRPIRRISGDGGQISLTCPIANGRAKGFLAPFGRRGAKHFRVLLEGAKQFHCQYRVTLPGAFTTPAGAVEIYGQLKLRDGQDKTLSVAVVSASLCIVPASFPSSTPDKGSIALCTPGASRLEPGQPKLMLRSVDVPGHRCGAVYRSPQAGVIPTGPAPKGPSTSESFTPPLTPTGVTNWYSSIGPEPVSVWANCDPGVYEAVLRLYNGTTLVNEQRVTVAVLAGQSTPVRFVEAAV